MKFLLLLFAVAFAQEDELTPSGPYPTYEHFEAFPSTSGLLRSAGVEEVVYKRLLVATDAIYTRVAFESTTVLAAGSKLKITSLKDGDFQWLNEQTLEEWDYTSAYFNGDGVVVEVFAPADTKVETFVNIKGLVAGENPPIEVREKTLCTSFDNRQRNQNRNRDARFVGGGYCSAWLINDQFGCFLTAGHCPTGGTMQFNVPNSTAGGGVQHPAASRQFTTQAASQQGTNGGVGNDWRYIGANRNSNTGLTARQAQNDWYTLRTNATAPGSGSTWQLFGHGSASGSTNLVLKGSTGSLSSISGTSARYRVSSTGGDSGSAVSFPGTLGGDANGVALAVHTHGGCTATGGANAGTWLFNGGLQNALRSPRGVCATGP